MNSSNRRVRAFFFLGLIISLIVATALLFRYLDNFRRIEALTLEDAQRQADAAAAEIDRIFGGIADIALDLAADLSDGTLFYATIGQRVRADLLSRADIDGISVTFTPYSYDPEQQLYQEYYYRQPNGRISSLIGASYDYSQPPTAAPDSPQTGWFHLPLAQGSVWLEPFFATGAQKILIEFGTPFTRVNQPDVAAGVVSIDYSLQGMRELVASLQLGETGYGFVLSQSGLFLSNPVNDMVGRSRIYDFVSEGGDDALSTAIERAMAGERFSFEMDDPVSGEPAWIFFEPIPSTNWTLGLVLNKAELQLPAQELLRDQAFIVLAYGVAAIFAIGLLARVDTFTTHSWWILSIGASLVLVVVIVIVLILARNSSIREGVTVAGETSVERYVETYQAAREASDQAVELPTGIEVHSLDFSSPTIVTVNGYIWQHIPDDAPEDLLPGVQFPQITGVEWVWQEIDRVHSGDETLIVWEFGVDLKQAFIPTSFPFDQYAFAIHLEPADIRYPVLLVPDSRSYRMQNPLFLPGIAPGVFISNWSVQSSYFSYQLQDNGQGLSIAEFAGLTNLPDLYFTINLQRGFVGPMLAYLLPGLVAAGMMFAFITGDPKVGDQEEIIATLSFSAALFFVITVAHTALRDSVAAVGITYLEYLYLVLYVVIILATTNAFLLVRLDISLLRFRNNLIFKLLYWPLFACVMLVATFTTFVFV